MNQDGQTISDRIRTRLDDLTRAERQLAHSILENYPASALGPLSALAAEANVSAPTVARMVQKLGFGGYPEFQSLLRDEVRAQVQNPIARHDTWAEGAPTGHMLNRFTDAVIDNIRSTLAQIDPVLFDRACAMTADPDRRLNIVGGRISHTLAEYLYLQMQVIRPGVTHIQSTSNAWPHSLLDVSEGDVFVLFDMRRYENNTLELARIAREKGARIILFTDQWQSPVHPLADVSFPARSVAPSAWDSIAAPLLLCEVMIATVQNLCWGDTRDRINDLEAMFDRTKLFRKFT